MKRPLEIIFSTLFFIVALPFLVFSAIAILSDSKGPVIFKQKRVGKKGKLFHCYKLRTMVLGAHKIGPLITAKHDSRVTRVGSLLRKMKIDELPQLVNVIKGDMSLVGPRPEVPSMIEKYDSKQKKVLSVKPGMIGPSQVLYRDEEQYLTDAENVEEVYEKEILPKKIEKDLAYITDKSSYKDLRILIKGICHVIMTSVNLRYFIESRRRLIFLGSDLLAVAVSLYLAFILRFGGDIPSSDLQAFKVLMPVYLLVRIPFQIYFGLYQTLWQYLGMKELINIIKAVTAGSVALPLVLFFLQIDLQARSIIVIDWFLLIILLGGYRVILKLIITSQFKGAVHGQKRVLIVGAGDGGELLVRELLKRPVMGYLPVGILDDDVTKQGAKIHGVKVLGPLSHLARYIQINRVDEVIIAIPGASRDLIRKVLHSCWKQRVLCKTAPAPSAFLAPEIIPRRLRPLDIADLFGRSLFKPDLEKLHQYYRDKKVLITGGGGSIGSELAKLIFQSHPDSIILVDVSESNLYEIEKDLESIPSNTKVYTYLHDVTNQKEIEEIFKQHKPDIIYHAAAFKHVPLVEKFYNQGVLTNVLGTKIMADCASQYGAECFMLISTDKAINPVSVMGASKRIAELYIQSLKSKKCRFLAVRFGNVFNSRGSVVPLFQKQIYQKKPLTVTHPEVTRYFMDVSEAVYLIAESTLLGKNSEVFILDMGEPVSIVQLAKDLARLAGVQERDIKIQFTGLRPGEKLHEDLEFDEERSAPTENKKIRVWVSQKNIHGDMRAEVEGLISLIQTSVSRERLVSKLQMLISEYRPERY